MTGFRVWSWTGETSLTKVKVLEDERDFESVISNVMRPFELLPSNACG
jgi:hypothetical protein